MTNLLAENGCDIRKFVKVQIVNMTVSVKKNLPESRKIKLE